MPQGSVPRAGARGMVLDTNVRQKPRSDVELMHIRPSKRIHQPRSDYSFRQKRAVLQSGVFLLPCSSSSLQHGMHPPADRVSQMALFRPITAYFDLWAKTMHPRAHGGSEGPLRAAEGPPGPLTKRFWMCCVYANLRVTSL